MKMLRNGCLVLGAALFFSWHTLVFAEQAPVYDADSPNAAFDSAGGSDTELPPPPGPEGSDISKSRANSPAARNVEPNSRINDRLNHIEEQLNATQSAAPNSRIENLQTEIQALRGQVEQLSHELKQTQLELRSQSDDVQQRLSKIENNKAALPGNKNNSEKPKNKKSEANHSVAPPDDNNDQTDASADTETSDISMQNSKLDPAAKLSQAESKKTSKKTKQTQDKNSEGAVDKNQETNDAPIKASSDSALAQDGNEEQALYQSAYGFIKDKKYPQAVAALQKMLAKYPSGQFSANAHYWLGELYGLMNKPADAEREFNQVIGHYAKSPRVPDAMLKVGLIYASEMKWPEAKSMFKKIVSKYPNTSSARLAQQQLKEIKKLGN